MAQKESSANPVLSQVINQDIAGSVKKNFEAAAAAQKQFLEAVNKANREWLACLNEGTALTSNFANKLTAARSIPDATAAYQEWAGQQMELFSKQAKKIFEDSQEFSKLYTNIIGNGKGIASS